MPHRRRNAFCKGSHAWEAPLRFKSPSSHLFLDQGALGSAYVALTLRKVDRTQSSVHGNTGRWRNSTQARWARRRAAAGDVITPRDLAHQSQDRNAPVPLRTQRRYEKWCKAIESKVRPPRNFSWSRIRTESSKPSGSDFKQRQIRSWFDKVGYRIHTKIFQEVCRWNEAVECRSFITGDKNCGF